MSKLQEESVRFISLLEQNGFLEEGPLAARKTVGLALGSLHTVILMEAGQKDRETQRKAVMECVDSVQRLIEGIKRGIELAGIEGCTIEIGSANEVRLEH